jgi:hypothetical protein
VDSAWEQEKCSPQVPQNSLRPVPALLSGDVVDESPIVALLTNSRWDPIDLYVQEINLIKIHNHLRTTQNLLHLPALRQLIHQLIQIPNLLRQGILNFLHPNPTDDSGDEVRMGV